MKNVLKAGFLAIAAATAFGSQAVAAAALDLTDGDKIKLTRTGTYGGGFGGGAFTASGVSVLNGPGDSFATFCVEFSEHISLNTPYYVKVNTDAVKGGAGYAATYDGDVSGSSSSDPISFATAWLYTSFREGTLAGYDGSNASNNSLQLAIWFLENEISPTLNVSAFNTYAGGAGTTQAEGWVSAAINAGWSDLGNVRVLNLYDSYNPQTGYFSGKHQDQLYLAPIPEPEIYAMLAAGLGLMGFVGRRRRQLAAAG